MPRDGAIIFRDIAGKLTVLATLILVGCSPAPAVDYAQCELEAQDHHVAPATCVGSVTCLRENRENNLKTWAYVDACMRARGWHWRQRCSDTGAYAGQWDECYEKSWFSDRPDAASAAG